MTLTNENRSRIQRKKQKDGSVVMGESDSDPLLFDFPGHDGYLNAAAYAPLNCGVRLKTLNNHNMMPSEVH